MSLGDLETHVGLDEPRHLHQPACQLRVGVRRGGLVGAFGQRSQLSNALERGTGCLGEQIAGRTAMLGRLSAVGMLETGGDRVGSSAAHIGQRQILDASNGVRRRLALQDARQVVADRHGADPPVSLGGGQVTVDPSVRADGVADDARLPDILLLKM